VVESLGGGQPSAHHHDAPWNQLAGHWLDFTLALGGVRGGDVHGVHGPHHHHPAQQHSAHGGLASHKSELVNFILCGFDWSLGDNAILSL